jgi:hypothetical protein
MFRVSLKGCDVCNGLMEGLLVGTIVNDGSCQVLMLSF